MTPRTPLVAVLAASVLAGCGGDDRLSKAEFAKRGNAICTAYNKKVKALGSPDSMAEIPDYVDRAIPLLDDARKQLSALEPPTDYEKDFDAYVSAADGAKAHARELAAAASENDQQALQRVAAEADRDKKASDAAARRVGLTTCTED